MIESRCKFCNGRIYYFEGNWYHYISDYNQQNRDTCFDKEGELVEIKPVGA